MRIVKSAVVSRIYKSLTWEIKSKVHVPHLTLKTLSGYCREKAGICCMRRPYAQSDKHLFYPVLFELDTCKIPRFQIFSGAEQVDMSPGSGVELDCIDSRSLHPYFVWLYTHKT